MAPVLSGLLGPEGAGPGGGVAGPTWAWPGGEQMVLVGGVTVVSALLLFSLLLMLCASCQGQKKAANSQPATDDHQNLMNGVSEKETLSQSMESPGTDLDLVASSSHNGPLTSGTVLTDTQDTSPQPSEEMLSSQTELRLSKCPQDRELPSIPPNSALEGMRLPSLPPNSALEGMRQEAADGTPAPGDGTYEVVKEVAVTSRDVSVEDSLYETVKELKEHAPPVPPVPGLPNGTCHSRPQSTGLLNGHVSPATPERGPLCAGVEYASIDLNKKSRHSADLEARRSASLSASAPGMAVIPGGQAEEEEEEERPPPIPDKVLDENDNQPEVDAAHYGLHNGELHSPLSPPSPALDRQVMENDLYSSVDRRCLTMPEEEREHDYTSIAEIKGLVPASSSSDLYATVRDVLSPNETDEESTTVDGPDPGYEFIRIPKTSDGEGRGETGAEQPEPDYESLGDLGLTLNRETSRL